MLSVYPLESFRSKAETYLMVTDCNYSPNFKTNNENKTKPTMFSSLHIVGKSSTIMAKQDPLLKEEEMFVVLPWLFGSSFWCVCMRVSMGLSHKSLHKSLLIVSNFFLAAVSHFTLIMPV